MAQLSESVLDQFLALDGEKRKVALSRMSDSTKQQLIEAANARKFRGVTSGSSSTADSPTPQIPESDKGIIPALGRVASNLNPLNIIRNSPMGQAIGAMSGPDPIGRLQEQAEAEKDRLGQPTPIMPTVSHFTPGVGDIVQGVSDIATRLPQDPSGAITEGIGTVGVAALLGKGAQSGLAARARHNARINMPKPSKPTDLAGRAFGMVTHTDQQAIHRTFNDAVDDFIQSERELGGLIKDVPTAIQVGKHAMNRVYETEIGRFVNAIDRPLNLSAARDELISQIPSHFSDKAKKWIISKADERFNNPMTGPEIEAMRQEFRAADRVNLAKNNYEQAAVHKLKNGWFADKANEVTRKFLVDEVQRRFQHDISKPLNRYGAITDFTQRLEGSLVSPSLWDRLAGHGYVTGTSPNLRGRAAEAFFGRSRSSDTMIRRAFDEYRKVNPNAGYPQAFLPGNIEGPQAELFRPKRPMEGEGFTDIPGVRPENRSMFPRGGDEGLFPGGIPQTPFQQRGMVHVPNAGRVNAQFVDDRVFPAGQSSMNPNQPALPPGASRMLPPKPPLIQAEFVDDRVFPLHSATIDTRQPVLPPSPAQKLVAERSAVSSGLSIPMPPRNLDTRQGALPPAPTDRVITTSSPWPTPQVPKLKGWDFVRVQRKPNGDIEHYLYRNPTTNETVRSAKPLTKPPK